MRIMRADAPFIGYGGVEGEWQSPTKALSGIAEALLGIAGDLYLPLLVANEQAFNKGL